MITSFRNNQSKMTAQNAKSALAFAVISFLLILIATFGVMYRYDSYPSYGTIVQLGPRIGLYLSHNTSADMKSEMSTERGKGQEHRKISPATHQNENTKEVSSTSDSGFFDNIVAVFASVKSGSDSASPDQVKSANEIPSVTRSQIKFPGPVQPSHNFDGLPKNNPIHPSTDKEFQTRIANLEPARSQSVTNPEKLYDSNIPKSTIVRAKDAFNGKSFYDRLIEMASKDVGSERVLSRNAQKLGESHPYEVQFPSSARHGNTQIFPPWIVEMFESSPQSKIDPRMFSNAFSGLENFLDGEFSSESFELPEFSLVDLLDDAVISLDDTEESDSDEGDFFFGRNAKHIEQAERLPNFPQPVVDFPLNRNFQ